MLLAAILLLATFLLPATLQAQQKARMPRIGYLAASHPAGADHLQQSFLEGLRELGYVEGQNILIERRSSEGRFERLPSLAAELVNLKVDLIVAPPVAAVFAVRKVSSHIPIVFVMVSDPVGSGLIESFAKPGGNATGLSNQSEDLLGKMVELLKDVVPHAARVAVLVNASNLSHGPLFASGSNKAATLKVTLHRAEARGYDDVARALDEIGKSYPDGLIVLSDPAFVSQREHIVQQVTRLRLPAIYAHGEYASAGGLMSYGVDLNDQFKRAARYVDRILKGAKPGDLPVEQPTRFELIINRAAAGRIGLAVPREALGRADRIIE